MAEVPAPGLADTIQRQMAQQWTGLLQVMTGQGASREDIMELALATAQAIITMTADPLWGERDINAEGVSGRRRSIPPLEFSMAALFVELESTMHGAIEEVRELRDRKEEQ